MSYMIELPDRVQSGLRQIGGDLFTDAEVIERLLDRYSRVFESDESSTSASEVRRSQSRDVESARPDINKRAPRQRGIVVKIDGHRIAADTVRDLYEQVLRWLVESDQISRLRGIIPFETQVGVRYLITMGEPTHPNGKPFVVPVEYQGLRMESHKDYKNAFNHLTRFLSKAEIQFEYLG